MKNNKFLKKILYNILIWIIPILTFADSLPNPIGEDNPIIIIAQVIRAMLGILGAVTLLMFIYGGFILIFSGGNQEKLSKGRGTLVWAIIGLAIVLSSYSILSYLFKILVMSSGGGTDTSSTE